MARHESDVLASLGRLGRHVPAARKTAAADVMRALCAGYPLIDDKTVTAAVAALSNDGKSKYYAAMARGPLDVLAVVEECIDAVASTPGDYGNLCSKGTKKRPRAVNVDIKNVNDHNRIRFTVYDELRKRFGYDGERVPLPTLAETLVKALFPGPDGVTFTWFQHGAAAARAEEERGTGVDDDGDA